jgi:hypothetical protein
LELRPKAPHFVRARSEIFLNCEQKYCTLFSCAEIILEFTNNNSNSLHFVLPRSQKFRNLTEATQINCILFCRAAKFFGICQQKQLKLTKSLFCRAAKKFGIRQQKQLTLLFCRAAKIFLKCEQKHCILFRRAAKILEFTNKSSSNQTVFCPAKNFGIFQQKQLKSTVFVLPRRNFWIVNKSRKFYSAAQRKSLDLQTSTVFCSAAHRSEISKYPPDRQFELLPKAQNFRCAVE